MLSSLASHQRDKLVDTTVCIHTGSYQYMILRSYIRLWDTYELF